MSPPQIQKHFIPLLGLIGPHLFEQVWPRTLAVLQNLRTSLAYVTSRGGVSQNSLARSQPPIHQPPTRPATPPLTSLPEGRGLVPSAVLQELVDIPYYLVRIHALLGDVGSVAMVIKLLQDGVHLTGFLANA